MKTILLAVLLTLGLAVCAAAAELPPPTVEALAADSQNLADELREAQAKIKDLEARLATVEQRLPHRHGLRLILKDHRDDR